jgi:hypothetical protein
MGEVEFMNYRTSSGPAGYRHVAGFHGVAAFGAMALQPALAGDAPSPGVSAAPPAATTPAPQGEGGMTVYVDPKTGQILSEPAPGTQPLTLSPQERNSLSTSHQGLREEPNSVPGGGYKLNLQGRFQNTMFGTVGADGKPRVQHHDAVPASHDQH